MKDFRKLNYFLGINFLWDEEVGIIFLSYVKYIIQKLKKFRMKNVKLMQILMEKGNLVKYWNNKLLEFDGVKFYQRVMGFILYLVNGIRFNIVFVC